MAKIKATIGGVAYEINAVKGITANNTEINVPLTIDGDGGGVGGYTEANTVTIAGSNLSEETIPISTSSYKGIKVAHGLSVVPKAVIITSDAATDGSVKGATVGAYLFKDKVMGYNAGQSAAFYMGVAVTTNASTGSAVGATCMYVESASPLASWAVFGMDDTYFYMNRPANNAPFNSALNYTFLFLG